MAVAAGEEGVAGVVEASGTPDNLCLVRMSYCRRQGRANMRHSLRDENQQCLSGPQRTQDDVAVEASCYSHATS